MCNSSRIPSESVCLGKKKVGKLGLFGFLVVAHVRLAGWHIEIQYTHTTLNKLQAKRLLAYKYGGGGGGKMKGTTTMMKRAVLTTITKCTPLYVYIQYMETQYELSLIIILTLVHSSIINMHVIRIIINAVPPNKNS